MSHPSVLKVETAHSTKTLITLYKWFSNFLFVVPPEVVK